jgi:hypothetical protein
MFLALHGTTDAEALARSRGEVPWLYAVFSAFSPSFSIVCARVTNFWIYLSYRTVPGSILAS